MILDFLVAFCDSELALDFLVAFGVGGLRLFFLATFGDGGLMSDFLLLILGVLGVIFVPFEKVFHLLILALVQDFLQRGS